MKLPWVSRRKLDELIETLFRNIEERRDSGLAPYCALCQHEVKCLFSFILRCKLEKCPKCGQTGHVLPFSYMPSWEALWSKRYCTLCGKDLPSEVKIRE